MKKRLIAGAIILGIICVSAALILNNKINANKNKEEVSVTQNMKDTSAQQMNSNNSDTKNEDKAVDVEPTSITVLVNKEYKVPSDYTPDDLVEPNITFSFNYKDEKRKLRQEAADELEELFKAAKKDGHELLGVSGYRSYERQKMLYEYNLVSYGYEYTQQYSAMPGTSEHQLGLSIDISCKSMKGLLRTSFGDTKEGKWVQNNSYKYGYIVRYSKNKTNITGYGYEPWHIRYVGQELAKYLYDNNLTLDEYYGYKLNKDLIDREQYAYYDAVLTEKNGGNKDYSQAVLDDVLDRNDVAKFEQSMGNGEAYDMGESAEPEITPDPGDILDGLGTSTESPEDSYESDNGNITVTIKPTEEAKPVTTPEPTSAPVTPEPTNAPTATATPSQESNKDKDDKDKNFIGNWFW